VDAAQDTPLFIFSGAFNLADDLYTSITGGSDNLAAATGKALTLPTGISCDSSGTTGASLLQLCN
jgi:hypothetical protein